MKKEPKSIHRIFSTSIIAISMIIIAVMSTALYYGFSKVTRQNAQKNTKEIITQVNYRLGSYITSILEISNYALDLDFVNDKQTSKEKLQTIVNSRHDIVSIAFFDFDGSPILISDDKPTVSKNEIIRQEWFYSIISNKKDDYNMYFSSPHIQHLLPQKFPWVITYSQKITYTDDRGITRDGILMIDMNFSLISEMIRSATLGSSGYLYIVDDSGEIVYHPKQTLIYAGLFNEDTESIENVVFGTFVKKYNNRDRLTVIQTVNDCKWRLVGIAYLDEVTEGMTTINLLVILLSLIFALLSIVIAWFVTNHITYPIKQLEMEMERFDIETAKLSKPIEGSKEVYTLSVTYIKMIKRIRKLMGDIVTAQDLKRKSELEALEAKINPHFLYNTLDSVVWMAEQDDTEGVITMVQALSKLFRVSISKGHEIITINEEIEHVRNYLLIQKMRYQNFDFKINLREDLKNCPTIKLLVQPVVENAIYHGIKYLVDPGLITIDVDSPDEKNIIISVSDNGVGMDEETTEYLLKRDKPDYLIKDIENKEGKGIGLVNVQERIQLTYGKEYGLRVESELDEGTTVYIKIPKNDSIHPLKVAQKEGK